MWWSEGGGETDDEEGIIEDESAGSTAEGDSPKAVVDWFRLEKLSSARMSLGNKETLGLVKRGVGVSSTRKEDMVENILCYQRVIWWEIQRLLERRSQKW